MAFKQPTTMAELVYFTRRTLEPKGRVAAWAFKKECPKCKQALMGKPVENGKVKIRATEYVCPACGYTEEKAEHEPTLELCVEYECPRCGKKGQTAIPYKRKTYQGVPAFIAECSCGEKIPVTKKLREPKKKGAAPTLDED